MGPTTGEWRPMLWPGAQGGFALWGEVLMTGVMMTVASLGVVTMPAAVAAGSRHLNAYLRAERSEWAVFWRDVRAALPGGLGVGIAAVVLIAILAIDIQLAATGLLPGASVIAAVGWLGLIATAVVLLTAAGQWDPEAGWRAALMRALSQLRGDVGGAAYLAATVGFVGVCTWSLPALLIPALGCAVLALVAIPARPRRPRGPRGE
ncbi:hypothetical protein [Demequina globuliformis]|uniref:hypothetical protein n=1 Tax=Demequina globuliformis TaxID=676202 RepID=UPI001F2EDD1B|nr:hypothetical protein [Demequina globuliformis]